MRSLVSRAGVFLALFRAAAACVCVASPGNLSTTLPNVLLVGDSISANGTGYLAHVQSQLEGLAHVLPCGGVADNGALENKGLCGTSFGVDECAGDWLLNGKWDVIHLNWGLHDIDAKLYAPVALEDYVANLESIIQTLKGSLKPGGSLVWASTTPVPPSYQSRNDSDVVLINAAAAALLQSDCCRDVVFGADLYARVVERCGRDAESAGYPATSDCAYLQDNGVHFSDLGRRFTGLLVAAAIAPRL
ncbi:hypothetical protein M885DRAFT_539246 [Pelagophyceae sp. CCMP2097]|nr:hypothetical protein M885DRAFT_539246 [Pelagophyceae sp. CCMP2097]